MQKSSVVTKSLDTKQESRKLLKRYVIALWFMGILAFTSFGFSVYTFYQLPSSLANYVSAHKEELKGDKGDKGDKGALGPAGINGANGASGSTGDSAGFTCNTYGTGSLYTTCY